MAQFAPGVVKKNKNRTGASCCSISENYENLLCKSNAGFKALGEAGVLAALAIRVWQQAYDGRLSGLYRIVQMADACVEIG
jgi:hypothetical protein